MKSAQCTAIYDVTTIHPFQAEKKPKVKQQKKLSLFSVGAEVEITKLPDFGSQ